MANKKYKIVKHVWREIDLCGNIEVNTRYYIKERVLLFLWGYVWNKYREQVEFFSKADAEEFLIRYRDALVSNGEQNE